MRGITAGSGSGHRAAERSTFKLGAAPLPVPQVLSVFLFANDAPLKIITERGVVQFCRGDVKLGHKYYWRLWNTAKLPPTGPLPFDHEKQQYGRWYASELSRMK